MRPRIAIAVCVGAALAGAATTLAVEQTGLQKQNEILFQQLQQVFHLTDLQMTNIRGIFARSGYMGQGNPAITVHPSRPLNARRKLDRRLPTRIRNSRRSAARNIWRRCTTRRPRKPSDAKGLHRSVRISGHPLRPTRGLDESARSCRDLRSGRQADLRCA